MESTLVLNGHREPAVPQANPLTDDQLLSELEALWNRRNEKDLEMRLQMGLRLNTHLDIGAPTVRKSYGARVLVRAAERLNLTKGELSRLRWFAHRFGSLDEFQSRHPEASTWSRVKVILAQLASEGKPEKAKPAAIQTKVSGVSRKTSSALKTATSLLRQLGTCPEGKERKKLLEGLQALVEAANGCLPVRLTFEERK